MLHTIPYRAALITILCCGGCAQSNHVEAVTPVALVTTTSLESIDLAALLPPPPALNSERDKAERQYMLDVQHSRTQAMCDRAQADNTFTLKQFFRGTGLTYEPTLAPNLEVLVATVSKLQMSLTDKAKAVYKRPRPYVTSPEIVPCITLGPHTSYPAGHPMWGYTIAVILSHMLPEKREIFFARADDFANQRIIGGLHYQSDVEAGKIDGAILADHMLASPDYLAKIDAAKAELKQALGL